jgi:branched-chain amino acid transport system ATP-binding protein
MNDNSQLLRINSLSRYFGGVKAVHEVTLDVVAGTIHGLIGPNGSGKTTLFNCLTGVCKPTAGSIFFAGGRIDGNAPHVICGFGIARTFQNLRLFGGMTLLENVLVGQHLHLHVGLVGAVLNRGTARSEQCRAVERARELLDFCGLGGHENDLASSLPYGLQRRLEVGRALATDPRLLLLDEPAAGMNPAESDALKALVRRIRDNGVTVFLIEHNVRLVMGVCERVSVMESGRLIADDTPEKVAGDPLVIEAYLGKDEDNPGGKQSKVKTPVSN